MNLHYKRDTFNVIPQILDEENTDDNTIKAYFSPRKGDTFILKPFPKGKHETLFDCYQSVITFRTRKFVGLFNTVHADSMNRHPIETTEIQCTL